MCHCPQPQFNCAIQLDWSKCLYRGTVCLTSGVGVGHMCTYCPPFLPSFQLTFARYLSPTWRMWLIPPPAVESARFLLTLLLEMVLLAQIVRFRIRLWPWKSPASCAFCLLWEK